MTRYSIGRRLKQAPPHMQPSVARQFTRVRATLLRESRKQANLSPGSVASLLGLTLGQFAKRENGCGEISDDLLQRWAQAVQIDLRELNACALSMVLVLKRASMPHTRT